MRTTYRSENYFLHSGDAGYEDYFFQENSLRITFRRFLGELKKRGMTSGRLLEVGCGYGYFLDEAKHFFSSSAGTELSREAGSHAEKLSGAHIHVGDIDSLPPVFANFSLIVLINVIEHIYSPIEFLLSMKQRLKDGGRIVIATPDIGSFWYKIMKERWPSFKVPEHVAFYSGKTLKLLLQKTGFVDTQRLPFLHAFPVGLIAHKLGIKVPVKFGKRPMWLPGTMTALSAKNFNE
jgi:SAM-dependent methyltransferase